MSERKKIIKKWAGVTKKGNKTEDVGLKWEQCSMRRSRTTTRDVSSPLKACKREREYWLGSGPLRETEFIWHMSRGAYYLYISRQSLESCNIKKKNLGGLICLPLIFCSRGKGAADASESFCKLSGNYNSLLSFSGWIAHIPGAVYSFLLSHSALSIRL